MPPPHPGIFSSAPRPISITPTTHILTSSPWHSPTTAEIRPFSQHLQILVDDKLFLRYYILRPPPDTALFTYLDLGVVREMKRIPGSASERCCDEFGYGNGYGYGSEKKHNFKESVRSRGSIRSTRKEMGSMRTHKGKLTKNVLAPAMMASGPSGVYIEVAGSTMQKLRDESHGLYYTIQTASTRGRNEKDGKVVFRGAAELPRVIACGDLYPLYYIDPALSILGPQFTHARLLLYERYLKSFPWLTHLHQRSLWEKVRRDCFTLAEQCRWRTGGWLVDYHVQRFYGLLCEDEEEEAPLDVEGIEDRVNASARGKVSADARAFVGFDCDEEQGRKCKYQRARIALRRKYLLEFPWYEHSCLKRKVAFDIGFLDACWEEVCDAAAIQSEDWDIDVDEKKMGVDEKDIVSFFNASIFDLTTYARNELPLGPERRLVARMERYYPLLKVNFEAMPESWRILMELDAD